MAFWFCQGVDYSIVRSGSTAAWCSGPLQNHTYSCGVHALSRGPHENVWWREWSGGETFFTCGFALPPILLAQFPIYFLSVYCSHSYLSPLITPKIPFKIFTKQKTSGPTPPPPPYHFENYMWSLFLVFFF